MKIANPDEQIKLYIRVLGDDTSFQYPRCIKIPSRNLLELIEIQTDLSASSGFAKRDKIQNSPLSIKESCNQNAITIEPKQYSFTFDYIFNEEDTLESISNYLPLDFSYHNCIISIGKSDIFTSRYGYVLKTISNGLEQGFKVEIGCASLNSDKILSLTEGFKEIKDLHDAGQLLFSLDYFIPRKPRDEINVTTIILTKDTHKTYFQFADINQYGRVIDTLSKVLTNNSFSRGGTVQAKDPLVQILTKSLCFGGKILIFGNIFPTYPYLLQTRSILLYIDNIMQNRFRNRNAYTDLLLKEVRKLHKNILKASKKNEEISSQMLLLKDQLYTQATQFNQEKNKIELECKKLEFEVTEYKDNWIKSELGISESSVNKAYNELENRLNKKEAELIESYKLNTHLKSVLQQLELEKKDFDSRYSLVHDRYVKLEKENADYKQKISDLQYSADQTWKHITVIESDLSQTKSKLQESEKNCKKMKDALSELEIAKTALLLSSQTPRNEEVYSLGPQQSLHTQYYELLVIMWRFTLGLKEEAIDQLKLAQLKYDELYHDLKSRELYLMLKIHELNDCYVKSAEKHDTENKKMLEEALKQKKILEINEITLKEDVEKNKKNCSDIKAMYAKVKEEYREEIHNFKHQIKEKLKEKQQEFNAKNEELHEQNKKLLMEKNQLLTVEVELKSKYELEIQQILEDKNSEIKNLQEQLEILKMIRDPRPKRNK